MVKVVGRTDELRLRYNTKDAVNARIEIKIYHPIMNLSQHKKLNPRNAIKKVKPKACNYCYRGKIICVLNLLLNIYTNGLKIKDDCNTIQFKMCSTYDGL